MKKRPLICSRCKRELYWEQQEQLKQMSKDSLVRIIVQQIELLDKEQEK